MRQMTDWWDDPDPINVVATQTRILVNRGYMPFEAMKTAVRFWEKVDRSDLDGCWPWLGTVNEHHGYGQMYYERKLRGAHRVSLILTTMGDEPGLDACHQCDHKPCVRPSHLFWGSREENMRDMIDKGRAGWQRDPTRHAQSVAAMLAAPREPARGERHGQAKLLQREVDEIRRLYSTGQVTQDALARRFGVSRSTIGTVVRGEHWIDRR